MNCNNYDEAKELEAKGLIKEFIEKYLDGDIENLMTFSFWAISGNPKFDGTCKQKFSSDFDGDRTKIVYAIDRLVYKDCGLPNFDSDFDSCYSGETINTFNTLFAKDLNQREKIKEFFGDDWEKVEDETQKENWYADDFYHVYQKIGNFMLFPCKPIYKPKYSNLNLYKGSWDNNNYDYIDLFLDKLEKKLPYDGNKHDTLSQIIEANHFFFTEKMTYDKFLKLFDLKEEYENLSFGSEHFYWWYPNLFFDEKIQEKYKDFSLNYIKKAKELIENRSERIVDKLKKELES